MSHRVHCPRPRTRVAAALLLAATFAGSGCSDCAGSAADGSTGSDAAVGSDHNGIDADRDAAIASDAIASDAIASDATRPADSSAGSDGATWDSAAADSGPTDTAPALDAQLGCDASALAVTPTGSGRYRTLASLPYPGLPARDVVVYLPAAYETEPARRFGVIYLHDGQNLFDPAQAPYGEWQVDETLDALTAEGAIAPQIAVGIANTGAERVADYTPDADPTYGGGNGAAYAQFVACAVKPTIDALFRTAPARASTVVMGSSLGGLISLHIYQRYPQLFGGVGAVSPSLWWNDRSPIASFTEFNGPLPARLWLDIGTAEGGSYDFLPYPVADARDLRDLVVGRGGVLGDNFGYLEDVDAQHNEAAWAGRLDAILFFLLSAQRPAAVAPDALDLFAYRSSLDLTGSYSQTSVAVSTRHGAHGRLTWRNEQATLSSDDDTIASIDSSGTVRAGATGSTLLRAQRPGVSGSTPIAVGGNIAVEFVVHVPATTPAGDTVYLTGSTSELGTWAANGVPLSLQSTDTWGVAVLMPPGTAFEYKYTRGDWATVEKNSDGSERANRSGTSDALQFDDTVLLWADSP